jgi:hypothetical protein
MRRYAAARQLTLAHIYASLTRVRVHVQLYVPTLCCGQGDRKSILGKSVHKVHCRPLHPAAWCDVSHFADIVITFITNIGLCPTSPEEDQMYLVRTTGIAGLTIAAVATAALAVAGCGNSATKAAGGGTNGSARPAAAAPAAPDKPSAKAIFDGTATKGGQPITACSLLTTEAVGAIIDTITRVDDSVASSCTWANDKRNLQFSLATKPWPNAITGDYSQPTNAPAPCTGDGDVYGVATGLPNVGAFCTRDGMSFGMVLSVALNPSGGFYDDGPTQIAGVGQLMQQVLDGTS